MIELIIAKDPEERRRALEETLKGVQTIPITLMPETFSSECFIQEVETIPFLSKYKLLVINDLHEIGKTPQETILHYVLQPNDWIFLVMTAESFHPHNKLVKAVLQVGKVQRFNEEKMWEKERRLSVWVVEKAQAQGVRITPPVALQFVKSVEPSVLGQELEKLICFVGEKKQITVEAIHAISVPMHHETLWQLGDAIFERRGVRALSIGKLLLGDGMSLFPLLANLRAQIRTACKTLDLYGKGGKPAVTQSYPYLKGGLLDKKLQLFGQYGEQRLASAQLHIYTTEIEARNSTTSETLLLELLLSKLCYDPLSAS